jgi:hypothetical protein
VIGRGVALAVAAAATAWSAGPARADEPAAPAEPAMADAGVVVLRLDATAGVDAGLTERVQREVEDRARRAGLAVTTGTANHADAAALAGCDAAQSFGCDDLILDTLGATELIYGRVDRSMSGHRVTIARVHRGGAPAEVVIDVPAGDLDGAARAVQPGVDQLFATPAAPAAAPIQPAPPALERSPGGGINARTAVLIGGAAVSGALVVVGLLQWREASSLQDEIDDAPDDTDDDIEALLELEDRADGYATRGNWLVIGGLALGAGTAAYWLFTRGGDERPATTAARIQPWISPHGGGVTVSWSAP